MNPPNDPLALDDPRELFLEHYRSPRLRGALANADAVGSARSPGGAILTIFLRFAEGATVERATFQSERCGIAVAYASLLVETLIGKTLAEARTIRPRDLADRFGSTAGALDSAALALAALHDALKDGAGKNR